MPFNKEQDLKIKYAYVDGESPAKYKKKKKKKSVKKSDHKHVWEIGFVDFVYPNNYYLHRLANTPGTHEIKYCSICGKVQTLYWLVNKQNIELPKKCLHFNIGTAPSFGEVKQVDLESGYYVNED